MSNWFFSAGLDGNIHLQARLDDGAGTIGDAYDCVRRGEDFHGIPHSELLAARVGTIEWRAGRWQISRR